jgi:hypothetical protein
MCQDILNQARSLLDDDHSLALYLVWDLQKTKDSGLTDLAWSMYKSGCTRREVAHLIDSIEAGRYLQ